MEKKNTLLLTVIAVATLLVAVVGATFAYFGSFTANANANAAINVQTQAATASSFLTTGGTLDLNVTSASMTRDLNGVVTDVANNSTTLGIELTATDTTTVTTCDYKVYFAYNEGSNVYVSHKENDEIGNGRTFVTPGLAGVNSDVSKEEFTYTITATQAAEPGSTGSELTIEDGFATAKSSFVDFENATSAAPVLVATGKIIAGSAANAAVKQALKIEVHFYNFPTLDQSQLAEKKFQGKFYVENDPESANKVVCTTTAA